MLSLLKVKFLLTLGQDQWPCQWLLTEGLWPPPESFTVSQGVLPAPQGMSPQLSGHHHLAASYHSNQNHVLPGPWWVIHVRVRYILMIDTGIYHLGYTYTGTFITISTYKGGIIILLVCIFYLRYQYHLRFIGVCLHLSFKMALNLCHMRYLWDYVIWDIWVSISVCHLRGLWNCVIRNIFDTHSLLFKI